MAVGKYRRLTIGKVREVGLTYSVEVLSEYYCNTSTILKVRCMVHPEEIFYVAYKDIVRGRGCPKCLYIKRRRRKSTPDKLMEVFKGTKYIPMFCLDEYTNCKELLPYICSLHPSELQFASIGNIRRGQACFKCGVEKRCGSNHHGYKGGVSEVSDSLRHKLRPWMAKSYEQYNHRCVITGESGAQGNLVVHHLNKPFVDILNETFCITNIEKKYAISEYTEDELRLLESVMLSLHFKYGIGVPVVRWVHTMFHRLYGSINNTSEQFWEFASDFMKGYIVSY